MNTNLIVVASVTREKFVMEHFIGSDDIFALVKSGSFYVESNKREFTVRENEGMLFKKDTLYNRRIIEPVQMFLFRYTGEKHLFNNEHVIFKDKDRLLSTIRLLDSLEFEMSEHNFKYKRHLFEDLVFQHIAENKLSPDTDEYIENFIFEIRNNFHKIKNVADFAEEKGLSYIQFYRKFKSATGLNPSDYIAALRIDKAKDLLINTNLQINRISSACGFENEYYFSNFFKKHTKLSPSAFRASLS